jgi:GNAT superfamily N-acetyltransferase
MQYNLVGGKSKGKTLAEVAKLHGMTAKELTPQFKKGTQHELEHTNNLIVARKIALDHLVEFPDYYDRLDKIEKMKKGAVVETPAKLNDIVLYHEKKGNWLFAKGNFYAWLYDEDGVGRKIESGEYDFIMFPPMGKGSPFSDKYVPPLLMVWNKPYQKKFKGAEHLIGIVQGFYDEDKNEIFIDMMTTNPKYRRQGINAHLIKSVREELGVPKENVIFDKPTKEGTKFMQSGKFEKGGEIDETAQMYIDIISMNPNLEKYQKYKEILKNEYDIDFDAICKDQQYIETANLQDIKSQNDFLDFDNWIAYAKKISKMRGFVRMDDYMMAFKYDVTDDVWKKMSALLDFRIEKVEYIETTGSGDIARVMGNTIYYTEHADLYYLLHEIGHIYDFQNNVNGIIHNPAYSPTHYGTMNGGETFAENFAIYFINPTALRNWNEEVYDEMEKTINAKYEVELTSLVSEYLADGIDKMHLGGDMSKHLAPNGKPSNLTHEQWHLVRTPAFKEWFGDWESDPKNASKVVDENGEPLVVHHGSIVETNFDIFDYQKADLGFHFGTKEQAKNRVESKGGLPKRKSIVNSFFLNIRVLFEMSDAGEWQYPQRYIDELISDNIIEEKVAKQKGFLSLYSREDNAIIRDYIKSKYGSSVGFVYNNKYEGKGKSFIALSPNEIKLADGSNTTFDGENPDMRFHLGGDMSKHLAPNGKPSNLTHEQWHLVRTPEFKTWFGDWENDPQNASKVVDENGEPLIMYHGTYDYGFTIFNKKYRGNVTGAKSSKKGFFFYDKKKDSEKFSKMSASGGVYEVFLNIKYPNIKNYNSENVDADKELLKLINSYEFDGAIALNIKDGFDIGNQYIVFEPNQIKLADGTNTTFDGNNPDIRFAKGGEIENLIDQGEIELKVYPTTPKHANLYGLKSENPLYIQTIFISENQRLKGIGKKVLKYLNDFAIENGHDVMFGHITQKASFSKDDSRESNLDDVAMIKNWLQSNGYEICEGNNDFYKVVNNPDIRFAKGGTLDFLSSKSLSIKIDNDIYKIQYQKDELGSESNPSEKKVWFAKVISKNGKQVEGRLCYADDYVAVIYGFNLDEIKDGIMHYYQSNDLYLILQDESGKVIETKHIGNDNSDIRFAKGGENLTNKELMASDLVNEQKQLQRNSKYAILLDATWSNYTNEMREVNRNLEDEVIKKLGYNPLVNYYPFSDKVILMFDDDSNLIGALEFTIKPQYTEVPRYSPDYVKPEPIFENNNNVFFIEYLFSFAKGNGQKIMNKLKQYAHKYNVDIGLYGSIVYREDQEKPMASAKHLRRFYDKQGFVNVKGHYFLYSPNSMAKGGRTIAQTPAPASDRKYGSKVNPKGSASDTQLAKSIKFNNNLEKAIENKVEAYNEKHRKDEVGLPTAKAVVRRGMGAYSKSHRPTISGGAPNSRQAWGLARLNKFLLKKSGEKVKSAYIQDDDLLKYANGGQLESEIKANAYLVPSNCTDISDVDYALDSLRELDAKYGSDNPKLLKLWAKMLERKKYLESNNS